MNIAEKIIDTLISKNLSSRAEVGVEFIKLCREYNISITQKQTELFIDSFCDKYLVSETNDELDSLFEEPEDEIEVLKNKIAAYQEKLKTNPANRTSIISMISKLRKKLRDLGYEEETASNKAVAKTAEDLKLRIEQLELDLALAPPQKVKSIQSMISKTKRALCELGDDTYIKVKKEKTVKFSPAELIGLDDVEFMEAFENLSIDESEPFNKSIITFIWEYAKMNDISLTVLAGYIGKYKKNIFSDKFAPENPVAQLVEKMTIKNLSKKEKSKLSLSLEDLNGIDTTILDGKQIRKIAKCSTTKELDKILS